jgi:hypothetical protein
MPAIITDHDLRTFSAAWVNTSGNKVLSYRAVRPSCKSEQAAIRGAERMLNRPEVQQYIKDAQQGLQAMVQNVTGQLAITDPTERAMVKAIAITEIQLINEYVATAMLDYLDYYDMRTGLPKPLQQLTPELRRNIKKIEWSTPAKNGRRKVKDYVLEDRAGARDQLARITGIVGTDFDFAGLLALMTGKPKEQAAQEVKHLDHQQGVNIEAIRRRAQVIEGSYTEVKP